MEVAVLPSHERGELLKAAGKELPNLQRVGALIDTGASMTSVDPSIIKALGIPPTGTTSVLTPSTGNTPHECFQYDVGILLFHHQILPITTIAVIEAELLESQGFAVLMGRDVLSRCLFTYNGASGEFALAF